MYELGDDWVYKEIKTEHLIPPDTKDRENRIILQRFWCSDTHYQNILRDFSLLLTTLSEWIPETYVIRAPGRFSDNPAAIVTLQQKVPGKLLSDLPHFTSPSLTKLTAKVRCLSRPHFHAPLDYHAGNIIIADEDEAVKLVDTGTPSDWHYLLDPQRLQTAIEIDNETAHDFVEFMRPHYRRHWEKLERFGR